MTARMETIRRLAESDPYWRAYLDGMVDRHAIRRDEPSEEAWSEYARLMQARIDRNTDTTDYDCEWTRSAATIDRERVMARRLGLPYPARLDVDPH